MLSKLIVTYRTWKDRPKCWMYIDETTSDGGVYIGASAVIVSRVGRKSLEKSTTRFRSTLGNRGIDPHIEIHANVWVQEPKLFTVNAYQRIRALGDYLRICSGCKGIRIINVLVDTTAPQPVGTDLRVRIWETLFWEFELFLVEHRKNGRTIFDRDRVGPVLDTYSRMRKHTLKRQLIPPDPANSQHHDAIQLADVCAYFMLQQFVPNNQIRNANATRYLNRISNLCPDPLVKDQALIRDLT